ncbi:hypothetical protein DPMN_075502 [Dreissena polymorpha]|uniref:Uncharacterized protein n=1 Tax=Dreissena polymorpha TaxID=45954 RepID=A0A9D3YKG8_DREPO|nr:hypothetical protein DPMN_075502 [Dreissena polymorpha]
MLRINLNRQNRTTKAEELLGQKSGLDSELNGAQLNRSSTAESSLRNTCNTNVSSSTSSSTSRKVSTTCGMMVLRGFNNDEGLVKVIQELYGNAITSK